MDKSIDARRAALAGLAGAAAYLVEQYLDLRLLRRGGDDLRLLGLAFTQRDPAWRAVGLVLHVVNGVALALFYAVVLRNRLPGAPILRGVLLAQIENTALWPLVPLVIDRYHPAIRTGRLRRFSTRAYAAQAVMRHLAYGAVMGGVYG